MKFEKSNTLVAIMNSKSDFEIARSKMWYRIPVKSAPEIVKKKKIEYIAFYQTRVFKEEAFSIRWYSKVKNISIVKRSDLFPELINDIKRNNDYYKINFEPLTLLTNIIHSRLARRIVFIQTTKTKLDKAGEINSLYNDSPIEDILWNEFELKNIAAERQFYVKVGRNNYFLDFALFCKNGKIDIECDGKRHDEEREMIKSDKKRNNLLTSEGWSVLRFTSEEIKNDLSGKIDLVKKTMKLYGE